MTQLILGTAQFGSAYGVTNARGRLDDEAVTSVLRLGRARGVDTFDTAADYGDSQERLGRLAPEGGRYVTKFSLPLPGESVGPADLFGDSMVALRVDRLSGVMFHKVADLDDPRSASAVDILVQARSAGTIERAGVSIYDHADLELALRRFPTLDLLQFPGNMLDRRLLDSPRIAGLRDSGVELHVRSAFLQGILLAPVASLSTFFAPLAPVLVGLEQFAARNHTTVLGLVLRYLRDHPVVDRVVVGATTHEEFEQIANEWDADEAIAPAWQCPLDQALLDPRHWPR